MYEKGESCMVDISFGLLGFWFDCLSNKDVPYFCSRLCIQCGLIFLIKMINLDRFSALDFIIFKVLNFGRFLSKFCKRFWKWRSLYDRYCFWGIMRCNGYLMLDDKFAWVFLLSILLVEHSNSILVDSYLVLWKKGILH